tara:strand:+ start:560 stop:1714 length:1155 start_codon:yes stop_codon:yes gene_type:complete
MAVKNTGGHPRQFNPAIPSHIDQNKIPSGLRYKPNKKSWRYFYKDTLGNSSSRTIGKERSTLKELELRIERLGIEKPNTFNWLVNEYLKDARFLDLKPATQKNYLACYTLIKKQSVKQKSVTTLLLKDWTSGLCQQINTQIARKNGPSMANHVHSFLSLVFTYGKNYDYLKVNPATGVYKAKCRPAQQWVTDAVYNRALSYAKQRGSITPKTKGSSPYYIWVMMEISYLCRLRGVETRTLTEDKMLDNGLQCERRKGSKANITIYNDRLLFALNSSLDRRDQIWKKQNHLIPKRAEEKLIIVNNAGEAISLDSFHSAWQKFIAFAIDDKIITNDERFSLHDLKRKGISDTSGTGSDKKDASGHRSDSMMQVYDKSLLSVPAASE